MADDFVDKVLRVGQGDGQALLNIIPVTLTGPNGSLPTYAILDSGAAHTLLQEEMAHQLGLGGKKDPFKFCWINNEVVSERNSKIVELDIIGPSKKKFIMDHVRTVEILKFSRKSVKSSLLKKWKHLSNLDIKTFDNAVPTILIGQPHAFLIVPSRRITGPPNAPVAAETQLGWVLNGIEPFVQETENVQALLVNQQEEDLHQLVKQHFTTEDFGVDGKQPNQQSKEDIQAEEYFYSNLKKENGHFVTRLL
jgi:hypothetical protein